MQATSHFDKLLPKLFRQSIKKAVLRVHVIHFESRTMRFFPGHDMEKNYDPKTGAFISFYFCGERNPVICFP